MPKYCCFIDPEPSFAERKLDEQCPQCGRPYGFPITDPPVRVDEFQIVEPLDRGFYGATYIVRTPPFDAKAVLKVVPVAIYELFGKDFENECQLHHQVSQDSEHVARIDRYGTCEVDFDRAVIPCHWELLEYVEGTRLDHILDGTEQIEIHTLAQIAVDLFNILAEFERRGLYHNDLQAANIVVRRLTEQQRRHDAIDELVRAVAIDLGSVSDVALGQDPNSHHLSDLRSIAGHLSRLVDRVLQRPEQLSDLTFRVARALEDHALALTQDAHAYNMPSFDEMAEAIKRSVDRITAPWRRPLTLRRFNHYDNAQQLDGWHIPLLLEDPDGEWVREISSPGPTLIKGMRGCGKTMLLRALEFHARLTPDRGESDADALRRVREEGFMGLYFPGLRLMDKPGSPTQAVQKPYLRLFVGYALQALRAIHHLRDVAPEQVVPQWHTRIAKVVATHVKGVDDLTGCATDFDLERELVSLQVMLGRDEDRFEMTNPPHEAFPYLAEAIRSASSVTADFTVLFLLDDVSTRYLQETRIAELFSSLLFQSPNCAFKLTTEGQTFEAFLRSSGQIEKAMRGRDYSRFDLGEKVYEKVSGAGSGGQRFIESILLKRATLHGRHPQAQPAAVLGDEEMEEIARTIASVEADAPERKSVYRGITALTKVCVGDISEVINIYDDILRCVTAGKRLPVPAAEQTRVFQDHCSGRLLDLTRRDAQHETKLRSYALGFAQASYELMMQSYLRPYGRNGQAPRRDRLRQYGEVYVRITAGDAERQQTQFHQIRELVDGGVFVLEGGTDKPRSKTRDSDPTQHFKLAYRKILGLSHFIGIAGSDRFELSGERLERWLNEPENCRAILLENLLTEEADGDRALPRRPRPRRARRRGPVDQLLLPPPELPLAERLFELDPRLRIPEAVELGLEASQLNAVRTFVLGLGFEERTLASARRLLDRVHPTEALAVRYPEEGHADEIARLVARAAGDPGMTEVLYSSLRDGSLELPPGPCIVDITGLAKPVLFHAVRSALRRDGEVYVVHTDAEVSWPREDELEEAYRAAEGFDDEARWRLLSEVHTGESAPYRLDALLVNDSDETRRRMLSAEASPRHARLLHLLDEMPDYDQVVIFYPAASTRRAEVAALSARIAAGMVPAAQQVPIDDHEVSAMLIQLGEQHALWYDDGGFNIELGLTGSKLHAAACAAATATLRFSRCWYVRPSKFDTDRFTQGVGRTRVFRLSDPSRS